MNFICVRHFDFEVATVITGTIVTKRSFVSSISCSLQIEAYIILHKRQLGLIAYLLSS